MESSPRRPSVLRVNRALLFAAFGMPGMSLMDPLSPTPPPSAAEFVSATPVNTPLVNRCGCGRVISANKKSCLACASA